MDIRLGPAGIPTTTSGGTEQGILDVAKMGLSAFEVEFVRGVKMSPETAKVVGKTARENNIVLSIHAPYFINVCQTDKDKLKNTKRMIIDSLDRGRLMEAGLIVFHPGAYGKLSKEEAFEHAKEVLEELSKYSGGCKIGLETVGKAGQFGDLDENLRLSKAIKNVVPVVDFAHIYARNGGYIDYAEVIDKWTTFKIGHYHSHFSCINFTPTKDKLGGNEKNHLPLAFNKPQFEPLAKEIIRRKMNITIISESPLLERDSLVMKKVFEKLGHN